MGSGGPLRDPEVRRDLLVAPAAPDERQDLELALRQRLDGRGGRPRPHALGEDPRGRRIEMDLVVVGRPDRGRDVVRLGVLEDEPARSGLERGDDLLLLDEAGQRDDLHVRLGRLDPPDRRDAVELRHDEVHEHHVGRQLRDELDRR